MQDKDIHNRLLQYFAGKGITEQEREQIESWMEENKENKSYYELIKRLSEEKKYLDQLSAIDLDQHLDRFRDNIGKNKSRKLPVRKIYLFRIAAAILVLILASTTVYFARFRDVSQIQQVSSVQQNTEILLSDGTVIILNKGSELSYPEKINRHKREVNLEGEAFFDVAKKANSPFYVYLDNTTVRVLGTSFNIKEDENGTVVVSVTTGKVVLFETGNTTKAIELKAGQKGIFDSTTGKFEQAAFRSENFLFWKTGTLLFEDQALSSVFEELEKSFGTRIVVEDQDILQNRLTSHCKGQQLDEILGELSILFAINCETKGDTVYIQKSP